MAVPAALTQYLTLVANTAASITINPAQDDLTVRNRDGAAEVFFTVDGSAPVVGANGTYFLPALPGAFVTVPSPTIGGQVNQVRLISTGAPTVQVDPTSIATGSGSAAAYITPGVTSLNAVAATANGTVLDTVNGRDAITMQVLSANTAPATTFSVQLQGSLDNTSWFNIGAPLTDPTAGVFSVSSDNVVARYFRAAATLAGGTGVQVTAKLLCVP
ncbi:hypothetical protein SEA_SONALI_4 [Arthrobacter phage Sonali]|uniref:Uncharacterized protein n=1 Tax=Arthrobacter phage Sonali TaxID=2510495 RepID=A0A411CQN5_9CAUD|nr:hypothetical protein HOV09_gp04 [Arthrobacter phage Sonali]QAY16117.1 hypothetical protein SEA_SONALI_4 [Arthrobacter phage Sonali]